MCVCVVCLFVSCFSFSFSFFFFLFCFFLILCFRYFPFSHPSHFLVLFTEMGGVQTGNRDLAAVRVALSLSSPSFLSPVNYFIYLFIYLLVYLFIYFMKQESDMLRTIDQLNQEILLLRSSLADKNTEFVS